MPVANPDGYQYTFDTERLWRKNLRDNDGDGQITTGDGVDLNRNYDERWNYDNEGSSTESSSDTYPRHRPGLGARDAGASGPDQPLNFKFLVTYHSYGPLLLYPYGWQVQTPSFDDPLFIAYTRHGRDTRPIEGFDPGVGADLYTTNGTTDDYAYSKTGALTWTPELEEGCDGLWLRLPGRRGACPGRVREEPAVRARPRAVDARPGRTRSPPRQHDEAVLPRDGDLDPEKSGNPLGDFRFNVSYGDPQPVRVLAKRSLGAVTLKYRINGGAVQTRRDLRVAAGGERYGPGGDVYYRLMRGVVTGTKPGRQGEGLVRGRGQPGAKSDSFTYIGAVETGRRVLVVAAEDYSGISPAVQEARAPHYLSYYLDALAANGIQRRRLRRRRERPQAPSALGVLEPLRRRHLVHGRRHHHARAGMAPGHGVAARERRAARRARSTSTRAAGCCTPARTPAPSTRRATSSTSSTNAPCDPDSDADGCQRAVGRLPPVLPRRVPLQRRRRHDRERQASTTSSGSTTRSTGLVVVLRRRTSAGNQDHSASYITTSGSCPADVPAVRQLGVGQVRPAGRPVRPAHGRRLRALADRGRLVQAADPDGRPHRPAAGTCRSGPRTTRSPTGTSCSSRPTRSARTTGRRCPTPTGTRARAPARTTRTSSCPEGWRELHPLLEHYQTLNARRDLLADRHDRRVERGERALGGWQQWSIDLTAYAGKQVEISISYVSDWSTQGLGVVPRRHDRLARRDHDLVRGRARRLGRHRAACGQRTEREQLRATTRPGSPRAPRRDAGHDLQGFGIEGITRCGRAERGRRPDDGVPAAVGRRSNSEVLAQLVRRRAPPRGRSACARRS